MKIRAEVKGRIGKAWHALRLVFIVIFLLQSLLPVCLGQDMQGIPSSLKSPQDIERWLSDFKSQMTIPDSPQTVREMLTTRAGDCDDFATLASKALAGLGIPSTVLVIKFKEAQIKHAICVWKGEDGSYNFFSNKQLAYTGEKSVEDVLKRYYPTFESTVDLDISERSAL